MTYKNNPEYDIVYSSGKISLYIPKDLATGYHISRQIAANAQQRFALNGANPDAIKQIANAMLDIVNKENVARIKSDIGVLANNLLFRASHPIDEDALLNMGAIYTFMENEPFELKQHFINEKIKHAKEDGELYSFLLNMGIELIPEYKELSLNLNLTEYLENRKRTLTSLMG